MSSLADIETGLKFLQMNNYTALGVVTAVLYDYFLTFSSEIHYVWRQHWSWVSTMFVLVRYIGLAWAIFSALSSTTFVTGPLKVSTGITFVNQWAFVIFLNAADSVMIVRVYAMWSQSKWILYPLLLVYVPQVIISIVITAVYNTSEYLTVTIQQYQLVGLSVASCNAGWHSVPSVLKVDQVIPRFVLGAMLLVLAVTQTMRQIVQMYTSQKKWRLNHYMERLVKDGIFYFLVNVLLNITSMLEAKDGSTFSSTALQFITLFYMAVFCAIMPRFIIDMRAMYERDSELGKQGGDTMGQLSQTSRQVVSAIAFGAAPGGGGGEEGEDGAIGLEPLGERV